MKVGILTWYKALNHGAVLQAYASQQYIKEQGFTPVVLDYERDVVCMTPCIAQVKRRISKFINRDFLYRKIYKKFIIEKKVKFDNFIKVHIDLGGNYINEQCDAIMIGSDMVFNLLQGYSSYMFGHDLRSKYIFSYAASAGGSTVTLAKRMNLSQEIKKGLKTFYGIGCRDQETKDFVKDISGRTDMIDTIDPVLLYGFNKEKRLWDSGKWKNHKPYLLVYSYQGYMNRRKEIIQIMRFASDNNLDIVSCGYYHSWCDENINADPKEFIEMFAEATCIITDTFHGTVFSLINEKNFCSIIRDNGFKLKFLLEQCGMDSNIAEKSEDIYKILNKDTEYNRFHSWIIKEREKSGNYLKQQLVNAEKLSGQV